ncbi:MULTISPECIES: aldehyde dehydrogenase family protein [Brevibacillus]|uniref:Aldehyde dehydrogenase n=1 Tax=Brevibacillus porteri TaxID=2126350 RepID=A0ABX5FUI9_9BACL|nr:MULTISPECIES: aldehyde dehydrogenase family protein [Brevibacillus]MDC0761400.1 aldehyde dehydrogenase family protein [Brevibacillus sp. AG]MED1799712.1 aldehyde dehydrogenase family protein [Brevibacillus porteri]MED2131099.1 aldehyde dehydrogenase family protein [Brevibacillus porteri]MED2747109.1 aldehyde dehydrogenase family protein [Brevibacillus porteri]MED2816547.1 aldehyde dehydrogenase family protein [Brevibacillus porteri]
MEARSYDLYIGGEWVKAESYIPVLHKYTGECIARIAKARQQHVTEAVEAAWETFKADKLTPFQRYKILLKASELMEERRDEMERSLIREVGKTRKDAMNELDRTINTLRLSAEEAKKIHGEMIPLQATEGSENRLGFTIRVPKGVIGAITPFNYPLLLSTHKIAPALAAGNTLVVKPATVTPIATFLLVEILEEAGLPKGYVNIVTGAGSQVGEWLLDEERIAMYTFTGSGEVGRRIKERSGMRPVALELGNNSPNIVHLDADLELAARQTAARSFHNAGQACIAVQRIYVHESVMQAFSDLYISHVHQLKVGNPEDPETDVGPMISEKEASRTEEWVQEAISQGARSLLPVKREGALFYPAVLVDTRPEMKVVCQEVFAPVVTIIPYSNLDDAFAQANDSEYGLQAGIFTRDLNIAMKAARVLEYGGVVINDVSTYRNDVMPYGGVKNSGLGKEGPRYAVEEMTEERMVVINL